MHFYKILIPFFIQPLLLSPLVLILPLASKVKSHNASRSAGDKCFSRRVLHFKPKLITQQTQLLLKRALAPRDAFINAAKAKSAACARAQKLSALQPPPLSSLRTSKKLNTPLCERTLKTAISTN